MPAQILSRAEIERNVQRALQTGDVACPYPQGSAASAVWRECLQRLTASHVPPVGRGGLARAAGVMCSNPRFQQFLGAGDADQAAVLLRRACIVESRRELDTNPFAADRFHALRRRFLASQEAHRGQEQH